MKVRIDKCKVDTWWYANQIGSELIVSDYNKDSFSFKPNNISREFFIDKSDCTVLQSDTQTEQWVPKVGEWVVVTEDYSDNLEVGKAYKVLNPQGDNDCYILDHFGDKSYSAPYSYMLRPALPNEIPAPEPKGFCIKRTPENAEVLNKWAKQQKDTSSMYADVEGYIYSTKADIGSVLPYSSYNLIEGFTELFTVEEFFAKVGYTPDPSSKVILDNSPKLIAKAGDKVKIIDFGKYWSVGAFEINKEYVLAADLFDGGDLDVLQDNFGKRNGYDKTNGMKFEKCPAPVEPVHAYPPHHNDPLWVHMNEQHDLLLTEGEMHDIIHAVNERQKVEPVKEEVVAERIPFDLEKWNTGKYDAIVMPDENIEIISVRPEIKWGIVGIHDKTIETWSLDGIYDFDKQDGSAMDLFLIPKTRTVFVNVWHYEFDDEGEVHADKIKDKSNGKFIETIQLTKPIQ